MAIKLTKNELKAQKESLKMYVRYLPTLQLKKQQLQSEIRLIAARAQDVRMRRDKLDADFDSWIAVFGERNIFKADTVSVREILTSTGNIAGVAIPVFSRAYFDRTPYDLFSTPLWVDTAADRLEEILSLDLEAKVLDEEVRLLEKELRTTAQRVNLFEKVKIPDTRANIKKIAIYLGDMQVAAVVRGKIAKKNLENTGEVRAQ